MLVLEGAALLSSLPTGLFFNKRALSLPAGAWPHDAEQDKGSIYPVKELETRKGPEAAKAHSPYLRHFALWCSGLVSWPAGPSAQGLELPAFSRKCSGTVWKWEVLGPYSKEEHFRCFRHEYAHFVFHLAFK